MEQPPDFLLSKHSHLMGSGNCTSLRMLYYPPIGAPEPDITRNGAHCDYGTFTLLTQVCLFFFFLSQKPLGLFVYADKNLRSMSLFFLSSKRGENILRRWHHILPGKIHRKIKRRKSYRMH